MSRPSVMYSYIVDDLASLKYANKPSSEVSEKKDLHNITHLLYKLTCLKRAITELRVHLREIREDMQCL